MGFVPSLLLGSGDDSKPSLTSLVLRCEIDNHVFSLKVVMSGGRSRR